RTEPREPPAGHPRWRRAREPRSKGDPRMIDDELKAILVCPACKGDLLFEETRIICPACRKAYPIRDGIPVMLINEAEAWSPGRQWRAGAAPVGGLAGAPPGGRSGRAAVSRTPPTSWRGRCSSSTATS